MLQEIDAKKPTEKRPLFLHLSVGDEFTQEISLRGENKSKRDLVVTDISGSDVIARFADDADSFIRFKDAIVRDGKFVLLAYSQGENGLRNEYFR